MFLFKYLGAGLARPTLLLAAGIAVGALLAPAFGGSAAQGLTTYTRAVSCPGLAWQPVVSDMTYWAYGTQRTAPSGFYICGVDLPHKAVVTRVRFTLHDSTPSAAINTCGLVRAGLTTATAANAQFVAEVGYTTDVGDQRLADTTISFATIDNMNFAYFLQCNFTPLPPYGYSDAGIYGADITYKITAANG